MLNQFGRNACDFITENMERVKKLGQQVTTAGWGLD